MFGSREKEVMKMTKLRFTLVLLIASLSAYALTAASIGLGGLLGMSDGGGF